MNKKLIKSLDRPAVRLTLIGAICLLFISWWIIKGEITLIHYPNATLAPTDSCGDISLTLHNSWAMITTVKCFQTNDTPEEISIWYKNRGWSNFGERMIFPNIQMFHIRFERGKEYLVKENINNSESKLIVQQIIYRYALLPNP